MLYLVGVESPPHPDNEIFITVSDDFEGFGPDLLSIPRAEWVTAESAAEAAWAYAVNHGRLGCRAIVNTDEESSTWWLGPNGPVLEEED